MDEDKVDARVLGIVKEIESKATFDILNNGMIICVNLGNRSL